MNYSWRVNYEPAIAEWGSKRLTAGAVYTARAIGEWILISVSLKRNYGKETTTAATKTRAKKTGAPAVLEEGGDRKGVVYRGGKGDELVSSSVIPILTIFRAVKLVWSWTLMYVGATLTVNQPCKRAELLGGGSTPVLQMRRSPK